MMQKKIIQIKKACEFCRDKNKIIDYKNVKILQKYISLYGKIESRSRTGVCAKHQRQVANAIKRARQVALLPFTSR
ncbi:MAG: 30S ribosomal protein S18 [Candidatus Woesearchaeota archaeon]